jgi:hypothetical protein
VVPDGAFVDGAVTATVVAGTLVAGGTCWAELAVARPIKKDAAKRTTVASATNVTRITCVRDFRAATGAETVVVFMASPFGFAWVGNPTRDHDRQGGGRRSTVRLRRHDAHQESSSDFPGVLRSRHRHGRPPSVD